MGSGVPAAASCPRKVFFFKRAAKVLLTCAVPENLASFQSHEHDNACDRSEQDTVSASNTVNACSMFKDMGVSDVATLL